MANIKYLGNDAIHDLLINLDNEEATSFQSSIEQALEDFSVGGERQHQPDPSAVARPNGMRALFRPFTSDSSVGAKLIVEPPTGPDGKREPLHGILVLMDGQGNPTGILAAEEVTGYRTSMNAMVPFSWRKSIDNIVIFGAGVQALWHTRLILTLRGSQIKTITYIGSSKERVDALIAKVAKENEDRWRSTCSFHFIANNTADFQMQLESRLSEVDCVFCTTPSTKPLFPASYLTNRNGDGRQPFISAVGSWQSDMIELDPELLRHCNAANSGDKPGDEAKGAVLVDDRNNAIENAGEVVQSGISAEDMFELGQIIALRKGRIQPSSDRRLEQTGRIVSEGFVVYKSVGVSLTDLAAGDAVLALAKKKK